MNTADLFIFLASIFGLASASPAPLLSAAASVLHPSSSRVSPAPVARDDGDHLCDGLTYVSYESGNLSHAGDIASDCDTLSQMFRNYTDEHGNYTAPCAEDPSPFSLLGSEGSCSLWFQCHGNDTTKKVTLGYGDIADVISRAIDGLKGSAHNISILSVNASTHCQTLELDWFMMFNGSMPGMRSQKGESTRPLAAIANDFIPAEDIHQ